MQGDTIEQLVVFLESKNIFQSVSFQSKRFFGPDDSRNGAYIRSEGDLDGRDYYRDGDWITGRYVFVADLTGLEGIGALEVVEVLTSFPKGILTWEEASENSEVIYRNETGEDLTTDCQYVMIRFELKTLMTCTKC